MKDKNNPQKHHDHDEEKERKILLWSGIIFFMVLIVSLWSFNFNNVLANISDDSGLVSDLQNDPDIDGSMERIADQFQRLEDLRGMEMDTEAGQPPAVNKEGKELLRDMSKDLKEVQQER
jgi:hypothetical protein